MYALRTEHEVVRAAELSGSTALPQRATTHLTATKKVALPFTQTHTRACMYACRIRHVYSFCELQKQLRQRG